MLVLLKRAFAALVLALVAVTAGAYLAARASQPQLEGEISLAGIDAEVTVERDVQGIPIIRASSRADLAFGTGFAHAQDRFFQMDLLRRRAAGELSALVGAAALELDRRNRVHRFRRRSADVLASISDRERLILEAYTAGVNAGLDSLRSRPFEYWLLGVAPEPWRVGDTLMAGYSMFLELNDSRANRDVRRGLAHRVLPTAVFDWLYPDGTEWDAPLMGVPRSGGQIPGPDIYSLRGRTVASLACGQPDCVGKSDRCQ